MPVMPPSAKSTTKPIAKSIALVKWIFPPQSVVIHEKILTPVGTAMTNVSNMNGSCMNGASPEVNM